MTRASRPPRAISVPKAGAKTGGPKPAPNATAKTDAAKRPRRTPGEAQALILDAAERVFAERLPDVAGLKDVAREAGVSHALVTHYFGTYEALVEATLERRFDRLRQDIVSELFAVVTRGADAGEMLAEHRKVLGQAVADPVTSRLAIWALLSGRVDQNDFFLNRMQGLRLFADALEQRTKAPREDIEFCLVVSFAMTMAWGFGRKALAGSLGKRASRELDADVEARTRDLLAAYLRERQKHK